MAFKFLQDHPDSKSRASVINFLSDMAEEGILEYEEETGKGGYQRIYYPKINKERFTQHIVETITNKLKEVFPEA